MNNKYWIEIFDKEDTDTIVDSFESYGSAYTFQNSEMKPGDFIFIYSSSEGRILYRSIVEKINAWTNDEGTVTYCNAILRQPMLISDSLTKDSLQKIGFSEVSLLQEVPNKITSGELLARLMLVFDNEDDYASLDNTSEKMRIIYSAKKNSK